MKKKTERIFSKDDLEVLIELIRKKEMREVAVSEISEVSGYDSKYITQAVSRDNITSKMIKRVESAYGVSLADAAVLREPAVQYGKKPLVVPNAIHVLLEKVVKIEATQQIMLTAQAELLSIGRKEVSTSKASAELKRAADMVNEYLKNLGIREFDSLKNNFPAIGNKIKLIEK